MTTRVAPTVSIVVRCRDEAAAIGGVLTAVLAQRGAPGFEVLALDSGSRDDTLAILASQPVRVAHLPPEAFSYGMALNRGAMLARGEIIVYLSAHCEPVGRDWLAALVRPFAAAAVVAVFGRQMPIPGVNPIEAMTTLRNFPMVPPAGVRFSTANGAVRRAAVLARPFDAEVAIAEDHLWALALGPAERIVYVPEAAVRHSHPMSLRHWRQRFYAHGIAFAYARARLGIELPWRERGGAARIAVRRTVPFFGLLGHLLRGCELRALAYLPAYAAARTVSFARGVRDGMRRYPSAIE
jgi:glycosyltransferase involved in cell wall biosynthesis